MAFTSLISPQVMELFRRSEAGDPQAKAALQTFQNSPELSSVADQVDVNASVPPAPMMLPGLAGLPQDLPSPQSSPSLASAPSMPGDQQNFGDIGTTTPAKRPIDWGQMAKLASMGLSSLGNAVTGSAVKASPGMVNQMVAQQYQEDQQNQLKRRQGMWDLAYKQSMELPPEIVADPKFASLAQAQAALQKDMQDGKVDNEKNVSLFLTELARFRPELDQVAIKSKVGLEKKLRDERVAAGLEEPMAEGNLLGTTMMKPASEWARIEEGYRKEAQTDLEQKQRQDELNRQHRENEAYRRLMAQEGSANRRAAQQATDAHQAGMATRQSFQQNMQRFYQRDPMTGEFPDELTTRKKALAAMRPMLFEGAARAGYRVEEPNMVNSWKWRVNDKEFSPDADGTSEMLEYLYSRTGVE